MARYGIAHAVIGVTYIAVEQENPAEQPQVLRLTSPVGKENFLLQILQEGDEVYCENGGASDKVALIAQARGCKVFRIPTFRLGSGKIKQDGKIADTPLAANLHRMNWEIVEEEARGGETGHELTVRRMRAISFLSAARNLRQYFLLVGDPESRALKLKQLRRAYRRGQKFLQAGYQSLLATSNDRFLLVMAKQSMEGGVSGSKVHSQAAREAIDALLLGIPENEREQFVARLGLEKFFARKLISRNDMRKMFRAIIDEMMNGEVTSAFLKSMKQLVKDMQALLDEDKIYQTVFKPLPGCGTLIATSIMANMVDIRRFETAAALKAYSRYHHFEDGSRARRRKGYASNWEDELHQASYQLCVQTIKLPSSPWRAKLDLRRAYELYKLLLNGAELALQQGVEEEILPIEFYDRRITNTYDMKPEDLPKLLAHVDALRLKAGIKPIKNEEEDEGDDEAEKAKAEAEVAAAKDPKLARLVRGLKKMALDKAIRWLGQQFLKHIFKEWNKALALPEVEKRLKGRQASTKAVPGKRTRAKGADSPAAAAGEVA